VNDATGFAFPANIFQEHARRIIFLDPSIAHVHEPLHKAYEQLGSISYSEETVDQGIGVFMNGFKMGYAKDLGASFIMIRLTYCPINIFELVANLFIKLLLVLAQLLYPCIEDEVTQNSFKDDSRQGYLKIIKKACQEGAQGVILGCTEIGFLVKQPDCPEIPLFDPLKLHAQAAVDMASNDESEPHSS